VVVALHSTSRANSAKQTCDTDSVNFVCLKSHPNDDTFPRSKHTCEGSYTQLLQHGELESEHSEPRVNLHKLVQQASPSNPASHSSSSALPAMSSCPSPSTTKSPQMPLGLIFTASTEREGGMSEVTKATVNRRSKKGCQAAIVQMCTDTP
jgi:hypothetical protein